MFKIIDFYIENREYRIVLIFFIKQFIFYIITDYNWYRFTLKVLRYIWKCFFLCHYYLAKQWIIYAILIRLIKLEWLIADILDCDVLLI